MFKKIAYISCWKNGDEWVCGVYSEKGKNLGRYRSKKREDARERAKKRLRQIEFFKHQKKIVKLIKLSKLCEIAGDFEEANKLKKIVLNWINKNNT